MDRGHGVIIGGQFGGGAVVVSFHGLVEGHQGGVVVSFPEIALADIEVGRLPHGVVLSDNIRQQPYGVFIISAVIVVDAYDVKRRGERPVGKLQILFQRGDGFVSLSHAIERFSGHAEHFGKILRRTVPFDKF